MKELLIAGQTQALVCQSRTGSPTWIDILINFFLPGAIVIKPFTAVSYKFVYYASAFVPDKPFQPSLMFSGKDGAYPSKAPFRCSTLE
jgi:hypothetical protein